VAGCMVTDGVVRRGARVRLLRDNVVIHDGALKTLKRFKDEVREVREGYECGMAFENYENIQQGDVIECFEVEEVARTFYPPSPPPASPAKAGIHLSANELAEKWIPACAGNAIFKLIATRTHAQATQ